MEGVYRVLNGNWKQESRPACGKSQYIQYKRISFLNLFLCRKDRLIFTIFTRCVLFLIGEVLQFCVCNIKPDSTSFFLRMMILGIAVAISTNNTYSHDCNKYMDDHLASAPHQVVALQATARHGLVEARATAQRDLQVRRK